MVEITASFPAGEILDTKANLQAAAEGEHEEWQDLYPAFADIAEKEGFADIAYSFREIAEVEEQHEIRYRKLLENVEKNRVFEREEKVYWYCRNCGYVHFGTRAPQVCPACKHPQAYYQLQVREY